MAQRTFKDFLAEGLPFGEVVDYPFIYDALRDPDFPEAESWQEVEGYIRRHKPDMPAEAMKAAQLLWQLYADER